MAGVSVQKFPQSDTRSRKDMLWGILQAASGQPVTRLCPCNTYSEKDLLYSILLVLQANNAPPP